METLRRHDLRRGGVHESVVLRVPRRLTLEPTGLGAVVLTDGSVAWMIERGPLDGRIVLRRADGRRSVVARGSVRSLGIEDGVTLRWRQVSSIAPLFFDVMRPPRGTDGCPVRQRFSHVHLSTPTVVVTQAAYGGVASFDELGAFGVWRACWTATGADPVIGTWDAEAQPLGLVQILGSWLLIEDAGATRYDCDHFNLRVYDVAAQRSGRRSRDLPCSPYLLPGRTSPAAVTATGIPAWVLTDSTQDSLRTIGPDGGIVELDHAPPGTISDLTTSGNTLNWSADGASRSALLP